VFKVYGHAKAAAGSTTQQIRVNGINYPVTVTTAYQSGAATPVAVDWSPTFEGTEFGFVNSTGASLTLGAMHGEVLYLPTETNWFGCGDDPSAPVSMLGGCTATPAVPFGGLGGSGCRVSLPSGADSGGGSGCDLGTELIA
jgi:hypothetical protein